MRGKLLVCVAIAAGACGETTLDPLDGSAGAAGSSASANGGLGGGGTGGSPSGGTGGSPSGGTGGIAGGAATDAGDGAIATGGTAGNAGSDGGNSCTSASQCGTIEYCALATTDLPGTACGGLGSCQPRPTSCPGECTDACSCGGESCSVCISRLFGHDATMLGSHCVGFGGASSVEDAGPGAPCGFFFGACALGLKCCYPCQVAGCKAACIQPDANGVCPTITPG